MITKKEDLINTYIENDYGELRDALFFKCADFEMKWLSGNGAWNPDSDQLNYEFICIDENFELMDISHEQTKGLRKLTLSDLKPRTRTEYEKVTESIFDLRDEFEYGLLFTKKFNQEWHQIKTEEQLGNLLSMNDDPTKNGIYRRVEVEIDERQEFIERAKDLIDASKDADYSLGNMYDAGCRFQD